MLLLISGRKWGEWETILQLMYLSWAEDHKETILLLCDPGLILFEAWYLFPSTCAMKFRCFSLVLLPQYAVAFHERKNNGTGIYTGSPCALVCQSSRAAAATAFYCKVKITAPFGPWLKYNGSYPYNRCSIGLWLPDIGSVERCCGYRLLQQ